MSKRPKKLTTITAAHFDLYLDLIQEAIKARDIEFLLEPDTEEFFRITNLPYDLILDWIENGCKSIEDYICNKLMKSTEEQGD